jgi:hypothetical protein
MEWIKDRVATHRFKLSLLAPVQVGGLAVGLLLLLELLALLLDLGLELLVFLGPIDEHPCDALKVTMNRFNLARMHAAAISVTSPNSAVHIEMKRMSSVSAHILDTAHYLKY